MRTEYNPERRTAVQVVPALIGVILNMTMVIFTAAAIVRERERGNLELLIAAPIRSWGLMAGKLLPVRARSGSMQTTLILTVGARIFDVPINGSLLDLYLAAALFIAATLTLGLVISTFARTQFQAFQMSFLTLLPSILLSGFVFPFDGMPRLAQWIAQILPLTHFVEIIRGILLRGAPLVRDAGAGHEAGGIPGHHARDRDAAIPQAARLTFAWPVAERRRGFRCPLRLGKADTRARGNTGTRASIRRRLSDSNRRGKVTVPVGEPQSVRPEAAFLATCGRMGLSHANDCQIDAEAQLTVVRKAHRCDAKQLAAVAEETFRDAFAVENTPEDMALHCRTSYSEAIQADEIANPNMVYPAVRAGWKVGGICAASLG